jgi:hypothetical protein
MSYAEGILLALTDWEDRQERQKIREEEKAEREAARAFDMKKFEMQLANSNRNAVLPLVMEQLRAQRKLAEDETEIKRKGLNAGFSNPVVNALWDSGQLDNIVKTIESKGAKIDEKFVSNLDAHIKKVIKDRNPDKIAAAAGAALTSSDEIQTEAEQKNALLEVDLVNGTMDELMEAAMSDVSRDYTVDPFDIRIAASERLEQTDKNRIEKIYAAALKPYMGEAIIAKPTGYGDMAYSYQGAVGEEVRALVTKMVDATVNLNRQQEFESGEEYTLEDITSQMTISLQNLLKGAENKRDAIKFLDSQFESVQFTSPSIDFDYTPAPVITKEEPIAAGNEPGMTGGADAAALAVGGAGLGGDDDDFESLVDGNILK